MTTNLAEIAPTRVLEPDGTPLDVFSLPTDAASLEELLCDLFENHWHEITFGILIQGAAWEMKADRAPTRIGMLDGTVNLTTVGLHYEREVRLRDHAAPTPAAVISRQTAIASAR